MQKTYNMFLNFVCFCLSAEENVFSRGLFDHLGTNKEDEAKSSTQSSFIMCFDESAHLSFRLLRII